MFLKFEEYVSLNLMKTVIKLQKNSEIIFGRKNLTRRDDKSRRAGSLLRGRYQGRHATLLPRGGALRDNTKNGCAAN